MMSIKIQNIISEFEKSKTISVETILRLSTNGDLYEEFIEYIRGNSHKTFSRALLKTATELRRNEAAEIMSDDLVFFSWFVSKNGEAEDLRLVVSAKVVDFDAWCGFDGEMVYTVLDFAATQEYLRNHGANHPEAEFDYLLKLTQEEIEEYKRNWRPPFT